MCPILVGAVEKQMKQPKTSNNTPDAADAFKDPEKFLKEHVLKLLRYFKENVSKILSDDVLAAVEYATHFIRAAYVWKNFESLSERYKISSLVSKKTTALKQSLRKVEQQEIKVAMLLKEASEVDVNKKNAAHVLALSYVKMQTSESSCDGNDTITAFGY